MRELVVLGTASQAPTRHRNHNGYFLRWDGEGVLFDPGEGTQRQFLLAGVSPASITAICITHFHGDHCLGLPGILQRLSLDRTTRSIPVFFPASGREYFDRLRHASVYRDDVDVRATPVSADGPVSTAPLLTIVARRLAHEPQTFGWRLEEPSGRRFVPELLDRAGISGPSVGALERQGWIDRDGRRIELAEVSRERPGQSMAFVMDTGLCDGALELAADVDLLVCESTFTTSDEDLARRYRHLTAADAARLARDAGARLLVLTHFSQRYPDSRVLADEAAAIFPDVVAAEDLLRVPVPARRG
ncbi:MAG TPA: ribonuclease Z [Acidimicrobiales bacterium]|nr:ribonuclease Z [Acidimicrobiales bacterium]